jgi:hypothetical protein
MSGLDDLLGGLAKGAGGGGGSGLEDMHGGPLRGSRRGSEDEAAAVLAKVLPQVVNGVSPNGQCRRTTSSTCWARSSDVVR